jgi:hypothetical protein
MSSLQANRDNARPDLAGKLATGLGWFSIGIGLVQLLAPRAVVRTTGASAGADLMRGYGLREIATGVAILSARDPKPWILVRLAGDALDLMTVAPTLGDDRRERGNAAGATAAVLGVTAVDAYCAWSLHRADRKATLPRYGYSGRSGLPRAPESMRGAASDFVVPADMRVPAALRPYEIA